ncbi:MULTISPECIES: porin family protein [Chryseobacterium]|uniref:porin family protein n=1 Tax=Chryseobacterium TaxID=59732 RepID=UPI0019122BA3|nr:MULTISPECIES: porin family protein [Chryseobacterium]MDQ8140925.1 porin family protein [Chryseobacterium sp. CFS15]QQQ28548.1 PorT family protein [Chryseobacterium indoltheticum]
MKKLLLIASVAVMGVAVKAQEFKFGPKAGYSLSMLNAEGDGESYKFDSKSTFYVGAMAEYKFNDRFAVQGEVLYSPIGGKQEESVSYTEMGVTVTGTQKSDWKFGTVQIPVSAKYYATESLAFGLGLNVGIVTSAKVEASATLSGSALGESFSESTSTTEDVKDDVNTLNLAPFIGAEYTLENGLFFDARYNLGVSNLIKNPEGNETLKNSFFQIGIGFKFGGN